MMRRFGVGGVTGTGPPSMEFEEFEPKSEWKEEEVVVQVQPSHPQKNSLLHIHLPGFSKEQLKVTFVQSSRILRVSGERPLSDTKRSRFNATFSVPQNCDVTKIQGKFQDDVLIITIPHLNKKVILPTTSTISEATQKEEPKSAVLTEAAAAGKKDDAEAPGESKGVLAAATAVVAEKKEIMEEEWKKLVSADSDDPSSSSRKRKQQDDDSSAVDALMKRRKDVEVAGKKGLGIIKEWVDDQFQLTRGEDNRQAMVSMGVAVIAVLAIGAFVIYRYRSSPP